LNKSASMLSHVSSSVINSLVASRNYSKVISPRT
jgi:hypothetical protein